MWTRRVLATLAATPLAASVLVGGTAAQAAPDPELELTGMSVTTTSVAVVGLNTVPIRVTVHGRYSPNPKTTITLHLSRVSGAADKTSQLFAELPWSQDRGGNTIWQGILHVPSTAHGRFHVDGAYPTTMEGVIANPMLDPSQYDGLSIDVKGSRIPKLTSTFTPAVVPAGKPYSIKWAVVDSSTGKPYGTRLKLQHGDSEYACGHRGTPVLTDTNGVLVKNYPAGDGFKCLMVPGIPTSPYGISRYPIRQRVLSATPSRTSAPVGTIVPVNGSAAHAFACEVNLQRLYGASAWRTVGTTTVRASGRFTVNAQPAYKGRIPYRAQMPKCGNYTAGVSKTFYIQGV